MGKGCLLFLSLSLPTSKAFLQTYPQSSTGKKKQIVEPERKTLFVNLQHQQGSRLQPTEMSLDKDEVISEISPKIPKIISIIGSSTSLLVSMTFFLILAIRRDALMVSFFLGAICNGVLSKVLKKLLNQERPQEDTDIEKPSDKGMPSSHAMSLGFIGLFTILSLNNWTASLAVPLYVIVSLYYRIEKKLHTLDQVFVGLIIGALNGYIWRYMVDGRNIFGINIMDLVQQHLFNGNEFLPVAFLIVPALAGASVVGSLERKIMKFIKKE
mmetsp:Transcript_15645/g.23696  ORF Transcript_15645/g.23696 Transcript_15645/m.23696 type:complete len:269 (+) Transcript_15645:76-882(+)